MCKGRFEVYCCIFNGFYKAVGSSFLHITIGQLFVRTVIPLFKSFVGFKSFEMCQDGGLVKLCAEYMAVFDIEFRAENWAVPASVQIDRCASGGALFLVRRLAARAFARSARIFYLFQLQRAGLWRSQSTDKRPVKSAPGWAASQGKHLFYIWGRATTRLPGGLSPSGGLFGRKNCEALRLVWVCMYMCYVVLRM